VYNNEWELSKMHCGEYNIMMIDKKYYYDDGNPKIILCETDYSHPFFRTNF